MTGRGLACGDPNAAMAFLRSVGYYRISAYVYPFREPIPIEEQQGLRRRSNVIRAGTTLEHVQAVWSFDRHLRLLCLDASETIEVGIRTRIAYVLGRRSPFGHINVEMLDSTACSKPAKRGGSVFEWWCRRYSELVSAGKNEDFVKHHNLNYADSDLPIWAAVELLDFGAVTRLFSLLKVEDQNEIAREVGVSNGRKLHSLLLTVSYVRNTAAHHSRTWNRVLTIRMQSVLSSEVGPDLHHISNQPMDAKLYSALAVMAYLVRTINPQSEWPLRLRERVATNFPEVPDLAPESDMGFPEGWAEMDLWNDAPRGTAFLFPPKRRRTSSPRSGRGAGNAEQIAQRPSPPAVT